MFEFLKKKNPAKPADAQLDVTATPEVEKTEPAVEEQKPLIWKAEAVAQEELEPMEEISDEDVEIEPPEWDELETKSETLPAVTEDVQVFTHELFGNIRAVEKDGEPWFVAVDVCNALGIANSRDAVKRLDTDEKGVVLTDTLGGKQELATVSEPGLYSLVMGSRKPEAKNFKRWITHEVIPSIRKHGAYMTAQTIDKIISDPSNFMKLVSALNDERMNTQRLTADNEKLSVENTELTEKIERDKPKVAFAESFKISEDCISVAELAKRLNARGYDTGEKRLYETLRNEGFLCRTPDQWNLPKQEYLDRKYPLFIVKEGTYELPNGEAHMKKKTMITPAGITYFYRRYCGENFRLQKKELTKEDRAEYYETLRGNAKKAVAKRRENVDNCMKLIEAKLNATDQTGRKVWVTTAELKEVIPGADYFAGRIFTEAARKSSLPTKVVPKEKGTNQFLVPAVLFPDKEEPAAAATATKAEKKPTAQTKLPPTSTVKEISEAIRKIIADAEKNGLVRHAITVDAFKWQHQELSDLTPLQVEKALEHLGYRSRNNYGQRTYNLPN